MRRFLLWGTCIAAVLALIQAMRIAFGQIATEATATPSGTQSTEPAFLFGGVFILLIILALYALMGYALWIEHIAAFRIIAGIYIVLPFASAVGVLLRLSSGVLLLAVIATLGIPRSTSNRIET